MRRRSAYGPTLAFSLANVVVSIASSLYTIFVIKSVDEKFRHAPEAALEMELFITSIIGFIGLLLFGSTLAYRARRGWQQTMMSIGLAALFGGIYAILPDALYSWHIDSLFIHWGWIVLMPVGAAWLTAEANGSSRWHGRSPCLH